MANPAPNRRRAARLCQHIAPWLSSSAMPQDLPPAPPTAELEEGVIFPTFPQLLETRKKLGGVFSYNIYGGHRMTFIADEAVWRLVFYAKASPLDCHIDPSDRITRHDSPTLKIGIRGHQVGV